MRSFLFERYKIMILIMEIMNNVIPRGRNSYADVDGGWFPKSKLTIKAIII